MKKFLKVTGIVILVFLAIAMIIGALSDDDTSSSNPSNSNNKKIEVKNTDVIDTPQETKKPEIEILNFNSKQDQFGMTVYAKIRNNTNKTVDYIDLNSYFYDVNKNIVGSGIGNAMNIGPGATKTIDILSVDDVSTAKKYNVEIGTVIWK